MLAESPADERVCVYGKEFRHPRWWWRFATPEANIPAQDGAVVF
jgi:hypothetical protein